MSTSDPLDPYEVKRTKPCSQCGISTTRKEGVFTAYFSRNQAWLCEPCGRKQVEQYEAARASEERAALEAKRDARWLEICPLEYRTASERGRTDEDRLSKALITTPDGQVVPWKELSLQGGGSIWLAGASGTMKTRIAWRLCRRGFDAGKAIHAFTPWSFHAALSTQTGLFRTEEWMRELTTSGVFFMDDIGKTEFSPSGAAALFELVEQRTSHGKPMIFTSNHSRKDIGALFSDSRSLAAQGAADALVRRLMEFCRAYLVTNV